MRHRELATFYFSFMTTTWMNDDEIKMQELNSESQLNFCTVRCCKAARRVHHLMLVSDETPVKLYSGV